MQTTYPIIIEKTEDGFYAECPSVQGVYAQGETENEVVTNLTEVLKMTLEDIQDEKLSGGFIIKGSDAPTKINFPTISLSAITI